MLKGTQQRAAVRILIILKCVFVFEPINDSMRTKHETSAPCVCFVFLTQQKRESID